MPIGCGQPFCASQQQSLDFSFRRHLFSRLDLFSSHLISSHCSFSWKLLTASRCHRSLCHPTPPHLISSLQSHLISCLLSWSQVFSSLLMSSELFSSLLSLNSSLLSSPQLLHSTQLVSTQLFPALLRFSHVKSSQLIPSHLSLSQLFSALGSSCHVSSSRVFSPHLSSFQLTLRSSQLFSGPKHAPKQISGQSHKKYVCAACLKATLKGKGKAPKTRKIIKNSSSPQTLAQPFQCDLQAARSKRPWNY